MDKTAMVSFEIGQGSEMVRVLEAADLKLNVALWGFLPEYEDWRLILAARQLDLLDLKDAYRFIHNSMDAAGSAVRTAPDFMILRMNDPFIKALRRLFGKAKSVEGMRLGRQVFGDRYLEDGYVYRLS